MSPAEPVTKDIPGEFGDNFVLNLVNDPSESDWDTTPTVSTIKFFEGMADDERRRGLFGDDESEGEGENEGGNGNIHDNAEQEVTFGFPILDLTRDVAIKNIPPSALPYFTVCIWKIQTHFCLNLISYVVAIIMLIMLIN